MEYKFRKFEVPENWKLFKNEYYDIEPDNKLEIEKVEDYFIQDMLGIKFDNFVIDLGFYGHYWEERKGFFRLNIFEGTFHDGKLYEMIISRSVKEINEFINFYIERVPKRELQELIPFEYRNTDLASLNFHIFSASKGLKIKLTKKELENLQLPKVAD